MRALLEEGVSVVTTPASAIPMRYTGTRCWVSASRLLANTPILRADQFSQVGRPANDRIGSSPNVFDPRFRTFPSGQAHLVRNDEHRAGYLADVDQAESMGHCDGRETTPPYSAPVEPDEFVSERE